MTKRRFLRIFGLSLLGAYIATIANTFAALPELGLLLFSDLLVRNTALVISFAYGVTLLPVALICLRTKNLRRVVPAAYVVTILLTCVVTAFTPEGSLEMYYWPIQWIIAAGVLVAIRRWVPDTVDDYVENPARDI